MSGRQPTFANDLLCAFGFRALRPRDFVRRAATEALYLVPRASESTFSDGAVQQDGSCAGTLLSKEFPFQQLPLPVPSQARESLHGSQATTPSLTQTIQYDGATSADA